MSVDLSTRYLGLELKNPLVVSACTATIGIAGLVYEIRLHRRAHAAALDAVGS